jgi:hypothetical protein
MKVSFFEEFPSKENLDKIKLIDFETKLYIAAYSLNEFKEIKKQIKNKHVKEIIYWPLIEMKEGYWFTPFSKRKAIQRIFDELDNKNIPTMIDLELPFTRNFTLFFTQAFNFFRNKKLIRDFIKNNKVYCCEYFPEGKLKDKYMEILGIHFSPEKYNNKLIKMFYSSMHAFKEEWLKEKFSEGVRMHEGKFLIGLGTIARGILGFEPILSKEELKKDLEIAKECNIEEVIIFRLGGLNREYVNVIKTLN